MRDFVAAFMGLAQRDVVPDALLASAVDMMMSRDMMTSSPGVDWQRLKLRGLGQAQGAAAAAGSSPAAGKLRVRAEAGDLEPEEKGLHGMPGGSRWGGAPAAGGQTYRDSSCVAMDVEVEVESHQQQ